MTTHTQASATIRARMLAQIETPESVAVQYDNEAETPPSGPSAKFIRFFTGTGADAVTPEIGPGRFTRFTGVATAQVLVKLQSGTSVALGLVDAIVAAFANVEDSGVHFRTPAVVFIGRAQDREWWQYNVTIPYYFEQTI